MIRAVTEGGHGGPLVVLGITEGNIERLKDGRPLVADLGEYEVRGPASRVVVSLLYGESHADVVRQLQGAGVKLPPGSLEAAERIDAMPDSRDPG